jgi:hypothetical protein
MGGNGNLARRLSQLGQMPRQPAIAIRLQRPLPRRVFPHRRNLMQLPYPHFQV